MKVAAQRDGRIGEAAGVRTRLTGPAAEPAHPSRARRDRRDRGRVRHDAGGRSAADRARRVSPPASDPRRFRHPAADAAARPDCSRPWRGAGHNHEYACSAAAAARNGVAALAAAGAEVVLVGRSCPPARLASGPRCCAPPSSCWPHAGSARSWSKAGSRSTARSGTPGWSIASRCSEHPVASGTGRRVAAVGRTARAVCRESPTTALGADTLIEGYVHRID